MLDNALALGIISQRTWLAFQSTKRAGIAFDFSVKGDFHSFALWQSNHFIAGMRASYVSSKPKEISRMKTYFTAFFLTLILGCATTARSSFPTQSEAHQELVERLDSKDKKVEIYWAAPVDENKKVPAVVYIHGVQDETRPGAINFVNGGLLKSTANLGYLAVGMSMPGYGHSSGDADFCGTGSQAALRSVLSYLRLSPDVDQDHIIVSGISCGATVAGMVAGASFFLVDFDS